MKLIKINKCKDCDDKRQCDLIPKREGGIIKYENVIPGECPLENYIELYHEYEVFRNPTLSPPRIMYC